MIDRAHHDLEGESQDASGCRYILSQPFGLGPHQPQDLCFGTVSHRPLQQGLQGLPERRTETMMNGKKMKKTKADIKRERNNDCDTRLPGAVVFLKVGGAEPDALFTGEHLQGVRVDGTCTLQGAVGNTLKHKQRPLHILIWDPTYELPVK